MSSDSAQLYNVKTHDGDTHHQNYGFEHKDSRHDQYDKEEVKLAGHLTHQKAITIEDLITKKMPAESYIEFFSQNNIEPVKAWNIFQLINHYVRHTTFNPHVFQSSINIHENTEYWIENELISLVYHIIHNRENLADIPVNLHQHLAYSHNINMGSICTKAKWNEVSSNIYLGKIATHIQKYKKEIKKAGQTDKLEILDLEETLEKTGVLAVTWPASWGNDNEIRQDVASLLLKINSNLSQTMGLSGPLLGLAGKVCIHLGVNSEDYGGLLYTSYCRISHTNFFNLILSGGFENTDFILSTCYHEWFHAFDRLLARETHLSWITHFSHVDTGRQPDLYGELSAAANQILLLKDKLYPQKIIKPEYSKIICTELIECMKEENYFVREDNKKHKDTAPFLAQNKLEANDNVFNSTLANTLYLQEIEYKIDHNDYSTYRCWILAKQWQLAGLIEKRKKPTRFHPVHILMWLSRRQMFSKCIDVYHYYEIQEITARSFEDMLCKNTGITNFDFLMLETPSIPGTDYRDAEQHWKSFFSALLPWWESKKSKTSSLFLDH